jgi:hypothetical protein
MADGSQKNGLDNTLMVMFNDLLTINLKLVYIRVEIPTYEKRLTKPSSLNSSNLTKATERNIRYHHLLQLPHAQNLYFSVTVPQMSFLQSPETAQCNNLSALNF